MEILLSLIFLFFRPWKIVFTRDVSLKGKVFLETPFTPEKGDYAVFPVFRKNPYYRMFKDKLLKIDVCDEGEVLTVIGRKYYCDGFYLGEALERDRRGNPVKNFVYSGKVPEGYFFAMGTHPRSYDSRYFGFVPKKLAKKAWRLY